MEKNQEKPHAIIVPFPMQGHIIPSVNLALNLASKGFIITFINTESSHNQITKASKNHEHTDIFEQARTQMGFDIRYETVSDGFPLEFDRSTNPQLFFEELAHLFPPLIDDLIGKLVQNTQPKISCLIADTFFVWSSMVANKYKLVNVSFWTQRALVFTLYYHCDFLHINGHYGSSSSSISGLEANDLTDLPSFFKEIKTTSVGKIVYQAFEDVKKADFIICNTIQELEPKVTLALNEAQLFYSIGPTFALNGLTQTTTMAIPTSLWSESDCTQWLNSKPPGSVLYVSFGSLVQCNKEDIIEIAHGLLLSKVSFIWVLRRNNLSSDSEILPVAFEDQIKDKGLIVPWCNQNSVISNPTVGGFLTHCGWNSVLESVGYGVPMLCYPVYVDQIINRKLVVDDLKIGLNLCDKKEMKRDEIAEKINRLMGGKSAIDLRDNIRQVKQKLKNAVSIVGSSENNFNKFIGDVQVKITNMAK